MRSSAFRHARLGFELQGDRGVVAGEIHRKRTAKCRDSGVFAAGAVLPERTAVAGGFQFIADVVGIPETSTFTSAVVTARMRL